MIKKIEYVFLHFALSKHYQRCIPIIRLLHTVSKNSCRYIGIEGHGFHSTSDVVHREMHSLK